MATETVYIVQAYVKGRGKALRAEPQVGCKDAEEARRKAEADEARRRAEVEAATRACLTAGGGRRHILNLSHGVDRRTPVDNVRAFLRTAGALERA